MSTKDVRLCRGTEPFAPSRPAADAIQGYCSQSDIRIPVATPSATLVTGERLRLPFLAHCVILGTVLAEFLLLLILFGPGPIGDDSKQAMARAGIQNVEKAILAY